MIANKEISEKKQALIDAKINSDITVGEQVWYSTKPGKSFPDSFVVQEINNDLLQIIRKDASVYKDPIIVLKSEVERYIIDLGANPFVEDTDFVRPVAYTLESIISNLSVVEKNRVFEVKFDGIECPRLNWNPFIYKNDTKTYYQRPFCWTTSEKQLLIESIYQGIDCGKILVRKRAFEWCEKQAGNGETEIAFFDIVDGKQRLNCIKEFILGGFADMQGNYYADLSAISQNKFVNNQLFSFAEMPENTTDEHVLRQFLKLNFTGVPQSREHIEYIKSLL